MPTYPPEKLKRIHLAIVDWLVLNPQASVSDVAEAFDISYQWASNLLRSDIFQLKLAERKAELVDPVLAAAFESRVTAVAEKGLEVLMDKLEMPSYKIKDATAVKAVELGLKARGRIDDGGRAPVVIDLEQIAAALAGKLPANRQQTLPVVFDTKGVQVGG